MNDKLISVIIPIYKVEKTLDRCIESIVNQTFKNLEIILVDDGSPDKCPDMCDIWAQKDNRITVIHRINGGLSAARNSGMEIAKGDYIAFVDSDDFVDLDMYQMLIKACEKEKTELVVCSYYYVDSVKNLCKPNSFFSEYEFLSPSEAIESLLVDYIPSHAWDKLYKKELLAGIRFPEGKNYEDIYVMHKIFQRANKILYIHEPKYYYVQNESSISYTKSDKNATDLFDGQIERYYDLKESLDKEQRIKALIFITKLYFTYCIKYGKAKVLDGTRDFLLKEDTETSFTSYCNIAYRMALRNTLLNRTLYLFGKAYPMIKKYRSNKYFDCIKLLATNSKNNSDLKIDVSDKDGSIWFLGTPSYGNLGDQAIAFATLQFIKELFPNKTIISVKEEILKRNAQLALKHIKPSDIVFLQGGGNVGDIYEQEGMRERILKHINSKVVIMPSTAYIKNAKNNYILQKYNKENILFIARESYTLELMKPYTKNALLSPDIVLYLTKWIRTANIQKPSRDGIGFCLRSDLEKGGDFKEEICLKNIVAEKNSIVSFDTVVRREISDENREQEIVDILNFISKRKAIVTDRLHAMIFSFLTNTPCIVMGNNNYKIKGVYQCIQNKGLVLFAENCDEVPHLLDEILLQAEPKENDLETQFQKVKTEIMRFVNDERNKEIY